MSNRYNEARLRAQKFLDKMIEDQELDCVDNERIALVGDMEQEAAYGETQAEGCCGFLDELYIDSETGMTFMVGCNYGH